MLAAVHSGQPDVTFLQGEAGLGKTRLLAEVQRLAVQQGFAVSSSRCHEDFSAPYVAMIVLLQQLWTQLTPERVPLLEADRQRIRALLQGDMPLAGEVLQPNRMEQEKLGLGLAIARALIALAQAQPLLLILDDLHWADASSLDLLTVLVFSLKDQARQAAVPLCFLAAYCPVASDTRLARLLARLQREPLFETIDLHGLEEAEMVALLAAFGIEQPAPSLLHTFAEVTAGSPLFIQELCHYLDQRQALATHEGQMNTALGAEDLRLSADVTTALLERLMPLSAASRTTLTLAALLGDECVVPVLSAVSTLADDIVLDHVDEAVQQGILVSEGQRLQFAHPFLRQALYHQPSVARRQQQHAHIAQTLLRLYGPTLEAPRCLEVAHHLLRAGALADPAAVRQYVRQAGDYALGLCDWPYAAQAYMAVLENTAASAALPMPELALLYDRAGLACTQDGDVVRGDAYRHQATAAYRQIGDLHGVERALSATTLRQAAAAYGTLADTRPLAALLEEVGEDDPGLRGRIAVALAELYAVGGAENQAKRLAQHSLTLGQQAGDNQLCARASFDWGLAEFQDLHPQAAMEHYQQARLYAQQSNDIYMDGWVVQRLGLPLQALGRFEEVRVLAGDAREVAAATNNWRDYTLMLSALTAVEAAMGAFANAERYAQETLELVARYHATHGGLFVPYHLAWICAVRGAWEAAESALDLLGHEGGSFERIDPFFHTCTEVYRQLLHTYRLPGGRRGMGTASWERVPLPVACDYKSLPLCCALVELSAAYAVPGRAAQLYQLIAPAVTRGVLFTRGWNFLTPRVLGLAASLNGWWDIAETHFHTALTIATEVGARPEQARTYLDYAAMLLARGAPHDPPQALELARKAGFRCHALEMTPFAQRAEQLVEHLQTRLPSAPPLPVYAHDRYSTDELDSLTQMSKDDTFFLG